MNIKRLRKIINLAKFIFEEKDYITFKRYINFKEYNSARLFLEKLIEQMEDMAYDIKLSPYKEANELVDEVIELIIADERGERNDEQTRKIA
ncbi:MAG TPA: hypothetical protein VF680_17205 [Allosphingosinicella sp.]|jgi:hypothetical protein